MSIDYIISEDDSWNKLNDELIHLPVPYNKKSVFNHAGVAVTLIINMDPGSGLQSGFEFSNLNAPLPLQFTSLRAPLVHAGGFRFVLHEEGVLDKVGKVFGMEDVEIGYQDFDKQLIVKTNNPDRVKKIFDNAEARELFQSLTDFRLSITHDTENDEAAILELMIDKAYTKSKELRGIYQAFVFILDNIRE
jgi:hypothetical protein